MKKRVLTFWLSGALAAAAMAAAVNAPAEVLNNLDFFSDFELLANLEILEDEPTGSDLVSGPAAALISTAAFSSFLSTETVKISTFTGGSYEKP